MDSSIAGSEPQPFGSLPVSRLFIAHQPFATPTYTEVMNREVPDSFKRNVLGAFPNGAAWLDALPSLITECGKRWQISVGAPFKLSYSFVAAATTATGTEAVLKIGVPNPELISEIRALKTYAGRGAVRLLDSDEDRGLLLMERLVPGEMLCSLTDDEEGTRIAARTMRELWRALPTNHSFPSVARWAEGLGRLRKRFNGGTGPFPPRLVEMAESLFSELLSSSEPPVLLHGDLQHFNILSNRQSWTALDPKGMAGERACEVGAFLRNPHRQLCTNADVQHRRIDVRREELGFDKYRIVGWGMAQAVLSAWWSYEDFGSGWESGCACAEVLARCIP